MKDRDFWDVLCTELGYRLHAGVPVKGHEKLYSSMNPEIMHYIPTVNESSALGIISGGMLSGVKGTVLMDSINFDAIYQQFKYFNMKFNVPVLFIVVGEYNPFKLKQFKFNDVSILNKVYAYMGKTSKSSILIYDGAV